MATQTTPPTFPNLPQNLLIISLKMYFTPDRTLNYLRALLDPQNALLRPESRSKLLLALIPDFLTIYPCAQILKEHTATISSSNSNSSSSSSPALLLGAQDCFWEPTGAYTGEVSPQSLRAIGASIVELGHAERRAIFGETEAQTAQKAAAACASGLVPLVCVGEVTAPAAGPGAVVATAVARAVSECEAQIRPVLEAIPAEAPVIFAYEPVWAIGKPQPAGVDHVAAVVEGIREVIGSRLGEVRVLYGGSAGPGLWGAGGLGKAVDGMFLGRFAHEIEGVKKVVREVEESLGVSSS